MMRPETFERLRRIGLALALLALASCGGGGGGGGSPPTPGSKLFITDGGNHALVSMINPTPTVGSTITIDRVVQGASTGLGTAGGTPSISSIPSIALDAANDRLFAATQGTAVIFDNAGVANGNAAFSRRISATVNTTGVLRNVNFQDLYVDTTNNILYVADLTGEVHAFSNASTRNGVTTPDRTVTPNLGTTQVVFPFGIAVDKVRNLLYVGIVPSGSPAFMIVFTGASTANTNTQPNQSRVPDRTFNLPGAGSFHLDEANDRLYVSRFDGFVWVFDNASGLTGTPTPNRTIDLTGGLQIQFYIFVDTSRNKLYAVGNEGSGTASDLIIVDNASTADEAVPGSVDGVGVQLTATNIRLSAVAVKPTPLGYYVPTGMPAPATVFDSIAETYRFPNNLTNSIWQRQANVIVTGEFTTSGYWAFPQMTATYPAAPNNGVDIHARMVQIPATNTVIYSRSPSGDGVGLGTANQFAVATISTTTGLLTAGQPAVFADGFAGSCQLASSSATQFLCYDGTVIRRYLTTPGSATLTANGTLALSVPLPAAARCDPGAACYGSTFAFDGAFFYFAADQGSSVSRAYIVYDTNGTLVNTFTATGTGAINGVYFDWSVGRYSAHDGSGGRTGGLVFGAAGSDTHCFSPISTTHTLQ